MKTYNFLILFWLIVFIAICLVFNSCDEHKETPKQWSQLNFYEVPGCKPIIAESGKTYTKWDFGGDSIITGCIRPVSELLHERDSLLKLTKDCTVFVYEGYIHPSGNYKWTKKGWQALRPFFKLSSDSSKLIIIK